MSNNNNENSFTLIIKDSNKEWSMKTYYSLLIILSIIELCLEIFVLREMLFIQNFGKFIFVLIIFLSTTYLFFSLYYLIKFKICLRTRKEIVNKINEKQIKSYRKASNILMIIGLIITIIYFCFIFFHICFNKDIYPSCEDLENKKNFENILSLKSCENNKCFNIKSNFINKDNENENNYKYNYLCNFRLNEYLVYNNENKMECKTLPKEKRNSIYISSHNFHTFFKDNNSTITKTILYFLISCDYDFNKYLFLCNSNYELNDNENSITEFNLITDYNENPNSNNIKESKSEENYKKGKCITLNSFLLSIFINLIIFFTFPIKVDIWYNENKRFEIIKKDIHPNRLRMNNNLQNNNLDIISISTENSSDKNSDLSISDNSQGENNIIEAIIIQK